MNAKALHYVKIYMMHKIIINEHLKWDAPVQLKDPLF